MRSVEEEEDDDDEEEEVDKEGEEGVGEAMRMNGSERERENHGGVR